MRRYVIAKVCRCVYLSDLQEVQERSGDRRSMGHVRYDLLVEFLCELMTLMRVLCGHDGVDSRQTKQDDEYVRTNVVIAPCNGLVQTQQHRLKDR